LKGYLLGLPYHFPRSVRGALVPGGMALVLPGGRFYYGCLIGWPPPASDARKWSAGWNGRSTKQTSFPPMPPRRAIEAGTAIGHTYHLLKATPLG
jgi:hypothetical protein